MAREPDCREMAPAELGNDLVPPITELVAQSNGVVAAKRVVIEVLLIFRDYRRRY